MTEVATQDVSLEGQLQTALSREVLTNAKVAPALAQLLKMVQDGELEGLDTETLGELAKKVLRFTPEVQAELESRKEAFVEKYNIDVVDQGKVTLNLGGTSKIQFLMEAQELCRDLYGHDAIRPAELEETWDHKGWVKEEAFTAPSSEDISINGNVEGTTDMKQKEQEAFLEKAGLSLPRVCDLAVAHAAYLIATGEDLFGINFVRAKEQTLSFKAFPGNEFGALHITHYTDIYQEQDLAAAAVLPAEE